MKRLLLALGAILLLVLPAAPKAHPTADAFVIIRVPGDGRVDVEITANASSLALALTGRSEPRVTAPAGSNEPVARAAPAVPALASRVRVSIVAFPKHAELLLDGRPVGNPLAQELAADSGPHTLRASADGYQTSSHLLSLERDVQLVIELEKVAPARAARGAATPAGRAGGSPP